MRITRVHLMIASAAAALLAAAAPVAAQQTTQPLGDQNPQEPTAPAGAAQGTTEDVVVTAQKREQTLIDVPQSVSVVSGATLETVQANNFSDYLKLIPGLQLNQSTPGQSRLIIRGINTGGVASTVGVYVDETPFGSSTGGANGAILAGDFDTFDIARIEVLRGPQGTLYGASSLSGVLKFVTNAPDPTKVIARARGSVEAVDGGQASYQGNLALNMPLGSNLAIRGSGTYRKIGGFIDSIGTGGSDRQNDINSARSYGGRVSALFTPSDALSFRLTAVLQNIEANAPSLVESDPLTLRTLYGRPTQSQYVPQYTSTSYRVYNGVVTLDLGFAELLSSTSYATQRQKLRTDVTRVLSPLIAAVFKTPNELYLGQRTENSKWTEELRLQSKPSDVFEWLIGGYYNREKANISQQYYPVVPGTLTPVAALPLLAHVELPSRYREIAGFADGTIHFGEHFDIDLGGRYSTNKQRAQQLNEGVLVGGTSAYPVAKSSEHVFTYSVAPKIKINRRASIYARVAKGFRPGGPNVLPAGAPVGTPSSYRSDTLTSYEAGVKAETADRSFAIELAAFHIDWSRIQLLAVVNNFGINTNGAGAKSDGGEFTATLRPTPGFNVSLNGAYTRARLSGNTSPLVGGLKGDPLPFTPRYSIGINSDYRFPLGNGDTHAFLGGSLRFLSKQAGGFDPTYRTLYGHVPRVPSYQVVDLRAGFDVRKFTVEAFASNVTNSQGRLSTAGLMSNGGFVYPNGALGTGVIRPRSIGLSITAAY